MRTVAIAVICLWSSLASAQNVASASYYLPGCKAYNEPGEPPVPVALRMTKCTGVIETLMILGGSKKLASDSQLCFPDGITAKQWELSDGDSETTNNRMELMAVITGLRDLPAPARVCVFIDSTYVKKNFGDWLELWQSNGWRTADGKPVKNRDLWEELSTEVQIGRASCRERV